MSPASVYKCMQSKYVSYKAEASGQEGWEKYLDPATFCLKESHFNSMTQGGLTLKRWMEKETLRKQSKNQHGSSQIRSGRLQSKGNAIIQKCHCTIRGKIHCHNYCDEKIEPQSARNNQALLLLQRGYVLMSPLQAESTVSWKCIH